MMQVMNLDAAKFTHLPHIIAGKVNEHIMFGQFLRIVCQILFQRLVLFLRPSSAPRPCNGHARNGAPFKTDECFR